MSVEDEALLIAFRECRIPGNEFDHRAHVRIAWLILKRLPLEQAIEEICGGIERLATHLGATGKYNRTMSEALVRLMAPGAHAAMTFEEYLAANPQLITDVRSLLARHYSPELLSSREASMRFVAPDRLALPS